MSRISAIAYVGLERKSGGLVYVGSPADIPSVAGKV